MVHEYDELRTYKDERVNVSRHFLILDFYGVNFFYDRQHVRRHPVERYEVQKGGRWGFMGEGGKV
jgi:hypothetical protein